MKGILFSLVGKYVINYNNLKQIWMSASNHSEFKGMGKFPVKYVNHCMIYV